MCRGVLCDEVCVGVLCNEKCVVVFCTESFYTIDIVPTLFPYFVVLLSLHLVMYACSYFVSSRHMLELKKKH